MNEEGMMKPKRITLKGIKDANISVTVSANGVEILTDRGNKINTLFLWWVEWDNVVAAVNEVLDEIGENGERR